MEYYLIVSAIMFFAGIYGFFTRRNTLAILISIELILNATDINFAVFNRLNFSFLSRLLFLLRRKKSRYRPVTINFRTKHRKSRTKKSVNWKNRLQIVKRLLNVWKKKLPNWKNGWLLQKGHRI